MRVADPGDGTSRARIYVDFPCVREVGRPLLSPKRTIWFCASRSPLAAFLRTASINFLVSSGVRIFRCALVLSVARRVEPKAPITTANTLGVSVEDPFCKLFCKIGFDRARKEKSVRWHGAAPWKRGGGENERDEEGKKMGVNGGELGGPEGRGGESG